MANQYYRQFFYTPHVMPILLDCNFIVDSTNGNGLGLRSLKGQGILNVFMNTAETPGLGNPYGGMPQLNPNPAAGVILVQLTDGFTRYFGGFSGFVSTVGASVTATVANEAMVITSLGTATPAQWIAVGLPLGVVPAVGATFIATASATIGGGATVAPTKSTGSGCDHIEVLGNPNLTIGPTNVAAAQVGPGLQSAPASLVLQCWNQNAVTAPADGTTVGLSFYLSNSSVEIDGE